MSTLHKAGFTLLLLTLTFLASTLGVQAQTDATPEPASTTYTKITVNHRGPIDDEKVTFSGDDIVLKAKFSCKETGKADEAEVTVVSGTKTRREITKELGDATKDKLPEECQGNVEVKGSSIIIRNIAPGLDPGTPEKPHEHPNDGTKVNKSKIYTKQYVVTH